MKRWWESTIWTIRGVNDLGPTTNEQLSPNIPHQTTIIEDSFDLVVLSVGMEISPQVRSMARDLGILLDDYGFCHTVAFDPVQTSRPGVFAIGPFREPQAIPESGIAARG